MRLTPIAGGTVLTAHISSRGCGFVLQFQRFPLRRAGEGAIRTGTGIATRIGYAPSPRPHVRQSQPFRRRNSAWRHWPRCDVLTYTEVQVPLLSCTMEYDGLAILASRC
jgi:hypothetical protein